MPSWFIHLSTANDVAKKIKVDVNEFLLSNLMPDFNSGYVIESNCIVDYSISHKGKFEKGILPDIEKFKQEYKHKMNNVVVLGYWTHLLTDYYWNKLTYDNCFIYNDNNEVIGVKSINNSVYKCYYEEARKIKTDDFKMFEKYLLNKNNINVPYFTEDILEKVKDIKEVYIRKKEILSAIEYLKKMKENYKLEYKEEYRIFSKEKLLDYYNNSIEFILDKIKQVQEIKIQ